MEDKKQQIRKEMEKLDREELDIRKRYKELLKQLKDIEDKENSIITIRMNKCVN